MRKIGTIGHLHGSSAASLVALALARNAPIGEAISPRHRGREYSLRAPSLGKTERT